MGVWYFFAFANMQIDFFLILDFCILCAGLKWVLGTEENIREVGPWWLKAPPFPRRLTPWRRTIQLIATSGATLPRQMTHCQPQARLKLFLRPLSMCLLQYITKWKDEKYFTHRDGVKMDNNGVVKATVSWYLLILVWFVMKQLYTLCNHTALQLLGLCLSWNGFLLWYVR